MSEFAALFQNEPCSPNRMAAQPHNRGTGVGEYETEGEANASTTEDPDGAEPLIIQEGGEPTSSADKPTDKSGSGPAKQRPTANDPADRTVLSHPRKSV